MPYIAIIVVVLIIVALYVITRPKPVESPPPEDYNPRPIPAKPPPPASRIFTDDKHTVERGQKPLPPEWLNEERRPAERWSTRGIWYETEIAGESNYQANIERYCTPGTTNIELTADLVLENDNPHDKNAVRVDIGGRVVGYLSRSDAKLYRKMLKAGRADSSYAALVRGTPGWRGIYLSLDMRNFDE